MAGDPGALRLATRGSALALAQAQLVADALAAAEPGLAVDLVPVRTSGDERRGDGAHSAAAAASGSPGDKSRFVKEIEEALLAGDADLAVHSAKDVPGELPDGLAIVGVPERADPRDAACGSALGDLPAGARVGTSSLRRRAQLLALRPDLEVTELRGNVDTRLRKLAEEGYDAIVLARAGLDRLGRGGEAAATIDVATITPAPGQGCLALEARSDDDRVAALADGLTHRSSLTALTAERALVTELGATCRTPVGALAEALDGDGLRLVAFAGLPDGGAWVRDELEGGADDPAVLGREVAERMLAAGAGELLREAEKEEAPA
jgi:hydroxymethylbilane synthase